MKFLSVLVGFVVVFSLSAGAAAYSGNVSPGFGGPIGLTSLTLSDNGSVIVGGENIFLPDASSDVSQIGLVPDSSRSFLTLGDSDTRNSSNGIGTGNDAETQAWNPFLQTAFGSYTVVPEPGTLTLFGLGVLAGCARFLRIRRFER